MSKRKNTKTVAKHYDEQQVNDWNLAYEYESENGQSPREIKVNATSGNASIFVNKSNENISVNVLNTVYNVEVINAAVAEITAIEAEFNKPSE